MKSCASHDTLVEPPAANCCTSWRNTLTASGVAAAAARHANVIVDPLVLIQVNASPVDPPLDGITYGILPKVTELASVELPLTSNDASVDADEFNRAVAFK